ncbi:MAG: cysteine--tRNA ligase, partial [Pseudoflavonifractor sp.]
HKWCNYWMHVHHLNSATGKMSKSKGEFLTVSLLEEKGYDPMVYRLFCLQSHYRKSLTFSYENLDNAKLTYEKLVARIAALGGEGTADETAAAPFEAAFKDALGSDLNTSLGITCLYDVLKADLNDATKRSLLERFDRVLGLDLLAHAAVLQQKADAPAEADTEIDALVQARTEAKKAKNFAEADRIRDRLKAMGVEVVDTAQGPKWSRS